MRRASASVASLRRALTVGARPSSSSSSRRPRRVVVVVVGGGSGASTSHTPRAMSTTTPNAGALHAPFERAVEAIKTDGTEQSWLERLDADPETGKHAPNRSSREVRSGHYVRVTPERLENPRLVLASESCAGSLLCRPRCPRQRLFFENETRKTVHHLCHRGKHYLVSGRLICNTCVRVLIYLTKHDNRGVLNGQMRGSINKQTPRPRSR